jgi:hypothetical protein
MLATMAMLVLAGVGAGAQTPQQPPPGGISPPFAQYLQSRSNRDVISQVIRMQVSRYPGACTEIAIDPKFKVVVIAPVQFDGQRFTAGAWQETVQATSCGKSRVHNVHTFVRQDGNLQRSPMLPGSTIADILLQRDTAGMVYVNVAAHAKDCPRTQHFIEDTKFLRWDPKPIPNAKAGPNARAGKRNGRHRRAGCRCYSASGSRPMPLAPDLPCG